MLTLITCSPRQKRWHLSAVSQGGPLASCDLSRVDLRLERASATHLRTQRTAITRDRRARPDSRRHQLCAGASHRGAFGHVIRDVMMSNVAACAMVDVVDDQQLRAAGPTGYDAQAQSSGAFPPVRRERRPLRASSAPRFINESQVPNPESHQTVATSGR